MRVGKAAQRGAAEVGEVTLAAQQGVADVGKAEVGEVALVVGGGADILFHYVFIYLVSKNDYLARTHVHVFFAMSSFT